MKTKTWNKLLQTSDKCYISSLWKSNIFFKPSFVSTLFKYFISADSYWGLTFQNVLNVICLSETMSFSFKSYVKLYKLFPSLSCWGRAHYNILPIFNKNENQLLSYSPSNASPQVQVSLYQWKVPSSLPPYNLAIIYHS